MRNGIAFFRLRNRKQENVSGIRAGAPECPLQKDKTKGKAENAVKTTIRDIANQLGVSASTVSKVINGKGSISPELRQKVLAVVEAANYQPNLNAKSLRTRTTNTIGVILPDITNLFYCYLMKGIEAKCQEENFSVLVGTCNFNYQREKEYFDLFRSKNVTGVIIASLGDMRRFHHDSAMVATINEQNEAERLSDWVSINNEAAARDLTQYLLNLGHRNVIFVNSGQRDTVSQFRQLGFTRCMEENGLTAREDQIFEGGLFFEDGYEAGRRIILGAHLPTLVICHNNTIAYGVSKAFRDAGYRVPDDISIACFDAINQGDMYGTQFTCVMQPVERIGREVAELLIRKSRGDIPEGQFVKKIVPYELVFGNSVKKL